MKCRVLDGVSVLAPLACPQQWLGLSGSRTDDSNYKSFCPKEQYNPVVTYCVRLWYRCGRSTFIQLQYMCACVHVCVLTGRCGGTNGQSEQMKVSWFRCVSNQCKIEISKHTS